LNEIQFSVTGFGPKGNFFPKTRKNIAIYIITQFCVQHSVILRCPSWEVWSGNRMYRKIPKAPVQILDMAGPLPAKPRVTGRVYRTFNIGLLPYFRTTGQTPRLFMHGGRNGSFFEQPLTGLDFEKPSPKPKPVGNDERKSHRRLNNDVL
jgi:hypothetical protein